MTEKEIMSEIMVQYKQCSTRSDVKKLNDGIDDFRAKQRFCVCKTPAWVDLATLILLFFSLKYDRGHRGKAWWGLGGLYKVPIYIYTSMHLCLYAYMYVYVCVWIYIYVMWTFNDINIFKLASNFICYMQSLIYVIAYLFYLIWNKCTICM